MNDKDFVILWLISAVIFMALGMALEKAGWEDECTRRGVALYHPVTGEFTWKTGTVVLGNPKK